jgi:retron-type reverse transcriptase
MKTYKGVFESMTSPDHLFGAWDVFKHDKRNKADVMSFERDLERHVFQLHRDLRNKTYRHGPYSSFYISDPKLRHIHKATVRDRVLHHAVFKMLNPIFEPTFIADSFSCRIGKGTHKGVDRLKTMLRAVSRNETRPCYALKCDVRKFFDSIDHEILLAMLEYRIKDSEVMWLLKEIVGSFTGGYSDLFHQRGVPIGNLTSQLFANVYMNKFDQFAKQELRLKHYIRYTDDFIVVSKDKAELEKLIAPIRKFLKEKLKLELHPDKIEIIKYRKGVDFLGYVQFPHHRLMREKSKQRMLSKIRHAEYFYRHGAIEDTEMNAILQSYLGVLKHADAYRLSENLKNKYWIKP